MKRFDDSTTGSPQSRPPLERMLRIHQLVQAGRFPNAITLAREIEVNPKTIHRDLEFMRDRLNLPLAFDSAHNGYHYTAEVSAFPTMQITEGEIFALVVAEKALQQYRGTSFERPLLSAIRKMEQVAAGHHFAEPRRHRADHFLPHARRAGFESGDF
jgi:predicted DNA-binding transcriptional regulator YafY